MNTDARALKEINRYSDLQLIYESISKKLTQNDRTQEIEIGAKRVSNVAAFSPEAASRQYRALYAELSKKEKELKATPQSAEVIEEFSIPKLPKLLLIDQKAGIALNIEDARTEYQIVLAHLDILRDDLAFQLRVNGRSRLPKLDQLLRDKTQYDLLRQRLTRYLTPDNKWSDIRALQLWGDGFCCDKPISPATYFTLSFNTLEITIDFQTGAF